VTPLARERTSLSGDEVRQMLAQAALWLRRNVEAINVLNVFPVPDGDTGANMAATLDAAVASTFAADAGVGGVLNAMAHGALMGARGNSGVILSQILRGLALGLESVAVLDAPALARAMQAAVASAYHAVAEPVEGTILTVLRDVAGVVSECAQPGMPLDELLQAAVAGARASVSRTPELLPILREAGVVDSGGLGLSVMLEGCLMYLHGEPLPEAEPKTPAATRERVRMHTGRHAGDDYGYCTEFLLEGEGLDLEALKRQVRTLGESVLVVGEPALAHVHLHALDPGPALSLGVRLGRLRSVKIENMDAQHLAFATTPEARETEATAVIAVALGAGFEQLLREYGASVVRGGQTMNPSTQEILDAIERAGGEAAIILPNNTNVIGTAEQAAALASKPARVVPSRSLAQGVAALLAYLPEASIEANAAAMSEAAAAVRTVDVTRAARAVQIDGVQARTGQPIGLVDGNLTVAAQTPNETACAGIERALTPTSSAVTIYYGQELQSADAAALAAEIERRRPGLDVQTVAGGQPFYAYIIAVE
jgi:DAK2 domain fusion protein YloV